ALAYTDGPLGPGKPRVIAARRTVAVLWPLALLVLFVATFRRTTTTAATDAVANDCFRRVPKPPPYTAAEMATLNACFTLDPTSVELMTELGGGYESTGRPDK